MIGVDKAFMNTAVLYDKRQATNWGPIWYEGFMVFSSIILTVAVSLKMGPLRLTEHLRISKNASNLITLILHNSGSRYTSTHYHRSNKQNFRQGPFGSYQRGKEVHQR
jgi:hypothetical protein